LPKVQRYMLEFYRDACIICLPVNFTCFQFVSGFVFAPNSQSPGWIWSFTLFFF
jgi:hypothetical protein